MNENLKDMLGEEEPEDKMDDKMKCKMRAVKQLQELAMKHLAGDRVPEEESEEGLEGEDGDEEGISVLIASKESHSDLPENPGEAREAQIASLKEEVNGLLQRIEQLEA